MINNSLVYFVTMLLIDDFISNVKCCVFCISV